MDNFEKCEYWLELADDDLETAKVLLQGKRLLFCGYVCNLIIEKAFKATIAKNTGSVPPKIHDLPKLGKIGGLWELLSDEQKSTVKNVIPLQIEARYPEYKESIYKKLSVPYCQKLVKETEDLLCWIKKQLET